MKAYKCWFPSDDAKPNLVIAESPRKARFYMVFTFREEPGQQQISSYRECKAKHLPHMDAIADKLDQPMVVENDTNNPMRTYLLGLSHIHLDTQDGE